MPAKVILHILAGPLKGRRFEFHEHDTFVCGRHPSCHAMLPKDRYVSRHHFLLEVNPPDARLRDLGSRNGTLVNGARFGGRRSAVSAENGDGQDRRCEVDLNHGDRIVVGKTEIQVRIQMPLRCQGCGAEVANVRPPGPASVEACYCAECKEPPVQGAPPPVAVPAAKCEYCGKDAAEELPHGQRGSYVCHACRGILLTELGGLRQLMLQAASQRDTGSMLEIPGHEIRRELGKGGMGAVYLGVREKDQRRVAVKILLAKIAVSETARQQFLREVKITEQLQHQHVVRFLGSGGAGSTFFLVMEYCSAGSLEKLLARHGGKLSLRKAKPIMLQCLEGLAYAHRLGFVHRDLKPQNILLHLEEGRAVAKISDFGLAKSFASAGLSGMTATGSFGGTLAFMPREQLTDFKYSGPASDIWSLAATFYLLLTGQYPRDSGSGRDPVEVVLQEQAVPIRRRNPTIPAPVAAVINRALAARAEDRFQTAGEMKGALLRALKLGG